MSCVTLEGAVMLVKGVTLGRDVMCYSRGAVMLVKGVTLGRGVICYSRGGCHASEGCYPRKGCHVLL